MLPAYPVPYHPYFIFPSILSPGNSIIYHNNPPYVIPSFHPQTLFQKPNSNQAATTHLPLAFPAQLQPFYKLQGVSPLENSDLSKTLNKTFKEKIIKKPANRPSTYLTERKYYLSQTLSPQEHCQRLLRPRQQKKKSTKSRDNALSRKQHADFQGEAALPCIKEEEINLKEELTVQKQKLSEHVVMKEDCKQEHGMVNVVGRAQEGCVGGWGA